MNFILLISYTFLSVSIPNNTLGKNYKMFNRKFLCILMKQSCCKILILKWFLKSLLSMQSLKAYINVIIVMANELG